MWVKSQANVRLGVRILGRCFKNLLRSNIQSNISLFNIYYILNEKFYVLFGFNFFFQFTSFPSTISSEILFVALFPTFTLISNISEKTFFLYFFLIKFIIFRWISTFPCSGRRIVWKNCYMVNGDLKKLILLINYTIMKI